VIHAASGEARNATATATSEVSPSRPSGCSATNFSCVSSLAHTDWLIAVRITPGHTVLAVIPYGAPCTAACRVSWMIPALVAP